jgi:homoserine kinase type II
VLRSGFAALAAFHQALRRDRTTGPSLGLAARWRELDGLIKEGFELLACSVERAAGDPHASAARQWLALARAAAPRLVAPLRRALALAVPLQPCLRDARPHHLLFCGERVTGLVDFGAMAIDSVAADLARLSSEWLGADRSARAEGLAAYAAVRPLDPLELALIDVFDDSTALLGGGHWVRWHFVDGQRFANPSAVAVGIARGLERLTARGLP